MCVTTLKTVFTTTVGKCLFFKFVLKGRRFREEI